MIEKDAIKHEGSWWRDWATWIAERSGTLHHPPTMGSTRYPPLADAPGTNIHGK